MKLKTAICKRGFYSLEQQRFVPLKFTHRQRGLKASIGKIENEVQLDPTLTDFRGLIIFFSYKQTFVIANKENKRN